MYYVYILFSDRLGKYYIGSTKHLENRLAEHNRGKSPFAKSGLPWKLVYSLEFENRSDALSFEMKIKKRGALRFLNSLL